MLLNTQITFVCLFNQKRLIIYNSERNTHKFGQIVKQNGNKKSYLSFKLNVDCMQKSVDRLIETWSLAHDGQ